MKGCFKGSFEDFPKKPYGPTAHLQAPLWVGWVRARALLIRSRDLRVLVGMGLGSWFAWKGCKNVHKYDRA